MDRQAENVLDRVGDGNKLVGTVAIKVRRRRLRRRLKITGGVEEEGKRQKREERARDRK